MTYEEFRLWESFRFKWGTLNPGRRAEEIGARQMFQYASANTPRDKPAPQFRNFLRYPVEDEEEQEFDAAAYARMMQGTKGGTSGK